MHEGKYHQLKEQERYQIEVLNRMGKRKIEIARMLGRSPSTISRELKRNTPQAGQGAKNYKAVNAQEKTIKRHRFKIKHLRFTKQMKDLAKDWLNTEKLSPELIYIRGKQLLGDFVSHETIYKWIWSCKFRDRREEKEYKYLYRTLKIGRKRYRRYLSHKSRGVIADRVSIEQRPAIVNRRKRFGDIEVDLVLGKAYKPGLIIMTDRASLKTWLCKIKTKQASVIANCIIKKLSSWKKQLHTLTFDNDSAFSYHQKIAQKLAVNTFFTRPHCSQDKGTVENRIWQLRRFYPKGTNFELISANSINRVQNLLNKRPVRKFNYLTPDDKLNKLL